MVGLGRRWWIRKSEFEPELQTHTKGDHGRLLSCGVSRYLRCMHYVSYDLVTRLTASDQLRQSACLLADALTIGIVQEFL